MKTAIIHIPDAKYKELLYFANICHVTGTLYIEADPRHLLFAAVLASAQTGDAITLKDVKDENSDNPHTR